MLKKPVKKLQLTPIKVASLSVMKGNDGRISALICSEGRTCSEGTCLFM